MLDHDGEDAARTMIVTTARVTMSVTVYSWLPRLEYSGLRRKGRGNGRPELPRSLTLSGLVVHTGFLPCSRPSLLNQRRN